MPRKMRVEYPGAIYHVMSRGDRREDIYLDDVDRHDFLKTLAEACQKTEWQVHAYCLMRNHFHLVVETPQANLVAGMGGWLSTYTIRLNHRHKLFGQRSGFCGRNCGAWVGRNRSWPGGARTIRRSWPSRRGGAAKRRCRSSASPRGSAWGPPRVRTGSSMPGCKPTRNHRPCRNDPREENDKTKQGMG